ncbi:MAG: hypothetical protein K6F74_05380 [Prevotella sp.]|nr:hypothetical protein [Prevotella sp.]
MIDYEKRYKEMLDKARKSYIEYKKELDAQEDKNSNASLMLIGSIGALELQYPELKEKESEDEKIRKALYLFVEAYGYYGNYEATQEEMLAWLEKQGEQKPAMIQWKGDNLREIIDFTGCSPRFGEWFKTWEEYEKYVHSHNNIFKIFNEDGSHMEIPVGSWIIKAPDGYNTASRFGFVPQSH